MDGGTAVGIKNLMKHIENIQLFGLNPIVAINKFTTDTEKELQLLKEKLEGKIIKEQP